MYRKSMLLIVMCVMLILPVAAQDEVTLTDAFGNEVVISDTSRIVTIGGAVTETVYALGMGEYIIAVDESSIYPEAATELPQIGYLRFLSIEPILALEPTLVITTEDIGPAEIVDQLIAADITTLVLPAQDTLDGTVEKMTMIATALSKVEEGEALIQQLQDDIAAAEALRASVEANAPRVMFVFARGQAVLTVSGTGTGADEMIRLAGAENAITDYEGYQPISAEAVITAAPDIILATSNGVESIGGMEAFMALPGIAETPAAANGKIIATLDDVYLLGFSPRLGQAILDLTVLLHDEIQLTMMDIFRMKSAFSIFEEGLDIAQYGDMLSGSEPYTVFAPDDAAFGTMPPGMQQGLYSSPISVMAVLGFHIVEGEYTAEDLAAMDGEQLLSFFGSSLTISVAEDGTISLNDEVQITQSDISASNGVIHVISGVLVPARP